MCLKFLGEGVVEAGGMHMILAEIWLIYIVIFLIFSILIFEAPEPVGWEYILAEVMSPSGEPEGNYWLTSHS